jgi:hypothetical protein
MLETCLTHLIFLDHHSQVFLTIELIELTGDLTRLLLELLVAAINYCKLRGPKKTNVEYLSKN